MALVKVEGLRLKKAENKKMKYPLLIVVLTASLAVAQAPDNTKTNKRDRNDSTLTADKQQKMSKADTDMVKKIRQSIIADKSLSTYGHNVKIVVHEGRATLRGPVRSQTERDAIQAKAAAVAGEGNVTNELEITPDKNK